MKIQDTNLKFLIMECLDLHGRIYGKQAGKKMNLAFHCQYREYFLSVSNKILYLESDTVTPYSEVNCNLGEKLRKKKAQVI